MWYNFKRISQWEGRNMLKIYICPKCYNFRMVSRKPDAICLHCGTVLEQCHMDYRTYMNMTDTERSDYKNMYKGKHILGD